MNCQENDSMFDLSMGALGLGIMLELRKGAFIFSSLCVASYKIKQESI
jgi:hypothetical protein